MKKKILFLSILIFLLFGIIFLQNKVKTKVSTFEIELDNKIGYISLYNTNKRKQIEQKIKELLKEYEQLTDRYRSYQNINNLYYIKTNQEQKEYIEIDKKLYQMIEKGLSLEDKTNGFLSITNGNIKDIWFSYQNQTKLLPTNEELALAQSNTVTDIVLQDENKIKNTHPNINLDDIKVAYLVDEIANLLEKEHITSYTIHLENVIKVGKRYNKEAYKIGIESPENEVEIATIVKAEEESIVSIGSIKEFSVYKDMLYHTFIKASSLTPFTKKEAFSIRGKSALETQIVTYMVYDKENKEEYLQQYPDFSLIVY